MNRIYQLLFLMLFVASCKVEVTDTFDRFFFRFEGADLAIQVDGNRDSDVFILFLHGGPGSNGYEYNIGPYSDLLENDFAMVYLDQRGQGASQGRYGEDQITLQQFSRDTEAVVKLLRQKYGEQISVFLMGHSWGGLVGTHALLNTDISDIIEGWIEVDGAHDVPKLDKEIVKMYQELAPDLILTSRFANYWKERLDFANSLDTNNITDAQSLELNKRGFDSELRVKDVNRSTIFELVDDRSLTKSPLGLTTYISSLLTASEIDGETEAASLTSRLDEIEIPTLLIWGRYDFVVPPALGISANNRISSDINKLVIFERSGHSPMDNEPTLFHKEVRDFIFDLL